MSIVATERPGTSGKGCDSVAASLRTGTEPATSDGTDAGADWQRPDFAAVYEQHYPDLLTFLTCRVQHVADGERLAQDLAQDTFLKAWRAWPDFRANPAHVTGSIRAWLFQIAARTFVDWYRRGRREGGPERAILFDRLDPYQQATEQYSGAELANVNTRTLHHYLVNTADLGTPLDACLSAERQAAVECQVRAALDTLPSGKWRLAVRLRYEREYSYAQIAEVLDTSTQAVKSLLFRAHERLRAALRPTAAEWSAVP